MLKPAVEGDLADVVANLLPQLPTVGALQVRTGTTPHRSSRCIKGVGFLAESAKVVTHGTGGAVAIDAICKRVLGRPVGSTLVPPPRPISREFDRVDKFVRRVVSYCPRPALLPLEQVALGWEARKRKFYLSVAKGVSGLSGVDRDARLRCFVKPEKHFDLGGVPTARIISPRSPRFNIRLAQFLKPLEKEVYHALDRVSHATLPTVLKSMNQSERGKAIHQHMTHHTRCVAIGLDASRFDQHVSQDALRKEHSVYLSIFGKNRVLKRLLDLQLENKCTLQASDCKLKWTSYGGRMSGDMNTSLGNVMLSVLMLNVLREQLGNDMTFINDGDDCVCFMHRKHLQKFLDVVKPFYLRFGFTMKVEAPVYRTEHVEFCQSKPVLFEDGFRMVRDPVKVMRQDGLYIGNAGDFNEKKWLYGVGYCGLMAASGCPMLQEFYLWLMSNGVAHNVKVRELAAVSGHCRRAIMEDREAIATDISVDTRVSFYEAFGINPTRQRDVEDTIRKVILGHDSAPTEFVL